MKVDSKIPVPEITAGRTAKYPFGSLKIGDSFFVAGQEADGSAASSAKRHGRANGKKFTARKVEGGVRIWRIA